LSLTDTLAKEAVKGGANEGRNYRYFGRLNYDYKSKYLLTINVSRDYSSNFGPQNKGGTFPSFSFGWKFTEEEFMKNINFLNFGKIRFGWGQTGANAKTGWPYLVTVKTPDGYKYATNGRTASIGAGPEQIANPAIKWESINMTNYGLDLGLFDNKLTLNAEYFIKVNDGMIMSQDVPYIAGSYNMTMPEVNIGSIENRGWDITIGHKNSLGDFKYSVDLNVSIVRNKILSLATDSLKNGGVHVLSPITLTCVGGSVSEFYGYETNGLFNENDPTMTKIVNKKPKTYIISQPFSITTAGDTVFMQPDAKAGDVRYVDNNGDGKLTDLDKIKLGSPLPKFTFGFIINLEYKMFDLNAQIVGSYGNKVFNGTRQYLYYSQGYGNRLAEFDNRYKDEVVKDGIVVVQANHNTDIPRNNPANYTKTTNFFIEDGSYIRLRSIQLGMTVPNSISKRVGIDRFRIYIGAKNLLTLSNYSGYDPVVSGGATTKNADGSGNGTMAQGIDIGGYPTTKMFLAGLTLDF
jgi:TonB-dependent starch-binding outer membrane protein SusC